MTTRSSFSPAPGYSGPPIVLSCGRHTKDGRFIPKNVKLTPGISRLSRMPRRRIPMAGDPSQDAREIYEMHMREKRRAGLFPGTELPDLILGRAVRTETQCRCGATTAIIRPGKGPHLGALHCRDCGSHRRWISRESFTAIGKFVAEIVVQLGVEPTEITFRNPPKREGDAPPPETVTGRGGKQYPSNGRVRLFPRERKQVAEPNEPAPFNDPIGF